MSGASSLGRNRSCILAMMVSRYVFSHVCERLGRLVHCRSCVGLEVGSAEDLFQGRKHTTGEA